MSNPKRQFSRKQFINGAGPSEIMQRAAKAVSIALPKEWGFALIAFPLDSRDGGVRYVANASRESVLRLLKDFVAKQEAKKVEPSAPEGN
jgi:hypothetical protein